MCSRVHPIVLVLLGLWLGSCKSSGGSGSFQCINDGDCPPGCTCDNDFVAVGVCDDGTNDCGGTCDRETACPPGTACLLDRVSDEVAFYSCQSVLGDLGADCQSNAECDPNASSLGAFCCLDEAQCGPNLNQCVEDCSTFSSGGITQEFEGAECQDNTECAQGLFCCLVPDAVGNCDFNQDQSCTCRGTAGL